LSILKATADNTKEKWAKVPLQDFTPQSDIDWTKSIPDIDKQLYAKYGLDEKEIAFIYGECKGMTFDRILLYPTKPLTAFLSGKKLDSQEKYYVAVTRPRFSLAIVVDKLPTGTTFEPADIPIYDKTIQAKGLLNCKRSMMIRTNGINCGRQV